MIESLVGLSVLSQLRRFVLGDGGDAFMKGPSRAGSDFEFVTQFSQVPSPLLVRSTSLETISVGLDEWSRDEGRKRLNRRPNPEEWRDEIWWN